MSLDHTYFVCLVLEGTCGFILTKGSRYQACVFHNKLRVCVPVHMHVVSSGNNEDCGNHILHHVAEEILFNVNIHNQILTPCRTYKVVDMT